MGTSGFILKKREDVDIYQLIHEVKAAAGRAGLISSVGDKFHVDYVSGIRREYVTGGGIANTFEEVPGAEAMPMDIFSDGYDEYDWILEGGHLIDVVIFDFISGCERILLDFLYEYFRSNPEDYFWCEGYEHQWYFTSADIIRIKQRGFNRGWCYKNPYLRDEKFASQMKSSSIGDRVEAEVGYFIKNKMGLNLTDFANKVTYADGIPIGDIDCATRKVIIEVKQSVGSVKKEQLYKLVDTNYGTYINVQQKKVVLYIDEPMGELRGKEAEKILEIKGMGVRVVNSLEELREALLLWEHPDLS